MDMAEAEAAIAPPAALFADLLSQLLDAKRDGALPDASEGWQSAGAALILALKAQHRLLCESTDALREAAGEAKGQLDQGSLQLQNLLYERQHYEKEISSCRGWRSAYSDEEIALVPVDDFKAHSSAVELKLAEEGTDPHQLMLNRLQHEVAYRQEFVKRLDGIKVQRDALAADVAQKRSTVAGLEAEVGKLLAAARAVQQQYTVKPLSAGGAGEEQAAQSPDQKQQQLEPGEAPPPPGADVAMTDL